jgi:hypothetical protein
MGISLFSSVFTILIVPRFARLPNYKTIIKANFIKLQILMILVVGVILFFTWIGGDKLLWIIGSKYIGLQAELFLAMLSSCVIFLLGSTYALYSTKGWVMHPTHSITVSILATILGLLLFDISTLKGVFYMNILVASFEYLNCVLYTFIKIHKTIGNISQ